MSWSAPKTKVGQWCKNFLIALDRLGNTLWGGDPDETISSRLGKMHQAALQGKERMRPIPDALHDALNEIQPDHCERSIDESPEAGDEAVVDRDIETEKKPAGVGGV
jgi:hypothetical protein